MPSGKVGSSRIKLRPLRAGDITVRFKHLERLHKLFKVMFTSDGSIAISFPYFPQSSGLVSLVTMPAHAVYPTDIDLTVGGKATSHLVKYSHHRSGEALFSQTKRVYAKIRRQSSPLANAAGHLFTIQLQGIDAFELDHGARDDAPWLSDDDSPKRRTLTFRFNNRTSNSLKFVGFCYSRSNFRKRARSRSRHVGPALTTVGPSGRLRTGWLLSAPRSNPASSTLIVLMAEGIEPLTADSSSHLTFIGGFDPPRIGFDHSKPTSFLALAYPADAESLERQIGTIDYRPEQDPLVK